MRVLPAALAALALTIGGVIGAGDGVAAPTDPASSPSSSPSSSSSSSPSSTAADTTSAAPSGSTSASTPDGPGAGHSDKAPGPACTTNADALTPVLCLPAHFNEDKAAHVVVGGVVGFAAQLVNNGPSVAGAKVVLTVPAQLRLADDESVLRIDDWYDESDDESDDSDQIDELKCLATDAGATLTCDTGAIPARTNALIIVPLRATSLARPDTSASFTVALQPDTAEAFPVTSVRGTVRFLLPAKLSVTVTPTRADVVLGRTRDLRVSVHNTGAGPAPDTFATTILLPKALDEGKPGRSHFAITNAPKTDFPIGGVTLAGASRAGTTSVFAARSKGTDDSPDPRTQFGLWPVGTIRPGATAGFTVTVKARSLGTDTLSVFAFSSALDPACENIDEDSPACLDLGTASLRAVNAPPAPNGSGTPIATTDPVANTGAGDLTPQLWFGLLTLLAGAALTYSARTRRFGAHRA